MSELPNSLRNLAKTVNDQDTVLVAMIKEAAKRIEELEASPANKLASLGLHVDYEARGVEIDCLRRELSLERDKVIAARKAEDEANEIIAKIAKAAECENFADIILARVEALAQQANAMTKICEGHIATSRRATAEANEYLNANNQLLSRLDSAVNDQNHTRSMLHAIADKLGLGSRNALPSLDWYLEQIDQIACNYRDYLDIIGASVGKPSLSYKALAEYFRGLDVEGLKKIADKANATEAERAKLAGELADALRGIEARSITLGQLAVALGVSQMEDGWATKMLNKAEHLMSTVNSKDYKWDKEKTDALQSLLKEFGFWPAYNHVEGLNRFKAHVLGQQAVIKVLNESLARANSRVSELEHAPVYERMRDLEDTYKEFERCKNRIATANARWNIVVADASNYPQQLDYLIDELETWRNKATNLSDDMAEVQKGAQAARDELALAGVAIKRMHSKLLENKPRTGIWPADGTFRAKLDDIEWCLYVYIGRVIADGQLREVDTKFISSVRDSLSHEILRRNKQ